LRKLFSEGKPVHARRVEKKQEQLAAELGITRQALGTHLRELRRVGLLKTGRGFIDLTEGSTHVLGEPSSRAFVFATIEPKLRRRAYQAITSLDVLQAFRVTGDVDLVVVVERQKLDKVLKSISGIPGVRKTSAHLVLASVKGK
jgi:DNA-binding Lrp family transcriptional regulator